MFPDAVSPHLAARKANHPISLSQIKSDFEKVCESHEYITVEGSGGIIRPLCYETEQKLFLIDVIQTLGLSTVIVADAGLGTINATVLTTFYLQAKQIPFAGIMLNRFSGSEMDLAIERCQAAISEVL